VCELRLFRMDESSHADRAGAVAAARTSHHRAARVLEVRLTRLLLGKAVEPIRIGRYALRRRLGQGAMGTVYSAYDEQLERSVALKFLHPRLLGHAGARARLLREARAMARLSHIHVVPIYDAFETQGELCIVMEELAGGTLASWLHEPREWRAIVQMFICAAEGLAAAHGLGVVHRDFKPTNVLLDRSGTPKVADFGLALDLSGTEPMTLTPDDAVLGTPRYVAPEVIEGTKAQAWSDQYSLCVALREALCPGGRALELHALRRGDCEMSGPPSIRWVVERGLANNPEDRWSGVAELVDQLREALESAAARLPSGPQGREAPSGPQAPSSLPEDKYEFLDIVGRGGSGTVYRARHRQLDKIVAVKVLHEDANATKHARFVREAKITAGLAHDNIVAVTDSANPMGGLPYIEMEFVAGDDLSTVLERFGPLPWPWVRDVALQVCRALAVAHAAGVVHRDIKPTNCRRLPDGRVKVLDFGIAQLCDHDEVKLTKTGVSIGTPAYMAPEQLDGGPCDARVDIYGLAAVIYELLTGQRPHPQGTTRSIIAAKVSGRPPAPSTLAPRIPASVDALILKALAIEPDDRFSSITSFEAAIRETDDAPRLERPRVWPWMVIGFVGCLGLLAFQHHGATAKHALGLSDLHVIAEVGTVPQVRDLDASSPIPQLEKPRFELPRFELPRLEQGPAVEPDPTRSPSKKPRRSATAVPFAALHEAAATVSVYPCAIYGYPGDEVVVAIEVRGRDGKVTSARAIRPSDSSRLGRCISDAVSSLRFPSFDRRTAAFEHEYRL